MNDMVQTINEMVAAVLPGALGKALVGLAILVVGLFVVRIIANIFGRLLGGVGFLSRTDATGESRSLVPPIVSLIKGVLTIFVLMAVLQHFGLTDVLAPLQDLANKFLGAVPNIIGAGVIAYAGWILIWVNSSPRKTFLTQASDRTE